MANPSAAAGRKVREGGVTKAREARSTFGRAIGDSQTISVRVITGRADAGKTRLALELMDEAEDADWDAGFATAAEMARFAAQQNLGAWGWQHPTLAIMDYAASMPKALHRWLPELAENASEKPLRLLLLKRRADPQAGRWQEVFGGGSAGPQMVRTLLDPADPVPLSSLLDIEVRRFATPFTRAVDRHARR